MSFLMCLLLRRSSVFFIHCGRSPKATFTVMPFNVAWFVLNRLQLNYWSVPMQHVGLQQFYLCNVKTSILVNSKNTFCSTIDRFSSNYFKGKNKGELRSCVGYSVRLEDPEVKFGTILDRRNHTAIDISYCLPFLLAICCQPGLNSVTNFQYNHCKLLLWIKPTVRRMLKDSLVDSDTPLNEPFRKPQKPYPAPQMCCASSCPSSSPCTYALLKWSRNAEWAHNLLLLERQWSINRIAYLLKYGKKSGIFNYCLNSQWYMGGWCWETGCMCHPFQSPEERLKKNFPQQLFQSRLKKDGK